MKEINKNNCDNIESDEIHNHHNAFNLVNNSNLVNDENCSAQLLNSTENLSEKLTVLTLKSDLKEPTLVSDEILKEAQKENALSSSGISYVCYKDETQMPAIMHLITKDLSEPYSIYTYRYFIHNWPHLCYLAVYETRYVGAIVCKLDIHKKITRRGYIAMLAVDKEVRRRKIGTNLVKLAIDAMQKDGCDEVVLETEVTNNSALRLYENLGFVRDKRLFRYYLNGVDALRLKLWVC